MQIDGHGGAWQCVIRVPAVDVTREHCVWTVCRQHRVRTVSVVRSVRRRGRRSHGRWRTLRADRLWNGRSRGWRRGGHLLLHPRLETRPVVGVSAFLVLQPKSAIVHAEHPSRLAKANSTVPDRVQCSDEILVGLRIGGSLAFHRGCLWTRAWTLTVGVTLRGGGGLAAARRRGRCVVVLIDVRVVRGGGVLIAHGAAATSGVIIAAGTSRATVLFVDARSRCVYLWRGKCRGRLNRQIRLTRRQSETWICVLHDCPLQSCGEQDQFFVYPFICQFFILFYF